MSPVFLSSALPSGSFGFSFSFLGIAGVLPTFMFWGLSQTKKTSCVIL